MNPSRSLRLSAGSNEQTMKDKLERFIRDNREDFDTEEPRPDLWSKIEQGITIPQQKPDDEAPRRLNSLGRSANPLFSRSSPFDWRIAASIAVLLLAGALLYVNQRYGVTQQPEVVAVSPAYAKEFATYTRLIDDKRLELKQMTGSNPALYQQFATDLDRLENSYQALKADLPANPNQEVLIQAMVQNLQLQIDLLNQQLEVIQCIKQQSAPAHENVL